MGKRQRSRQRAFGMRKQPNESKQSFQARFLTWLGSFELLQKPPA